MQSFSGATLHSVGGRMVGATIDMEYAIPFDEQVEEFDKQNLSGETDRVHGEGKIVVDDSFEEYRPVGKVGNRVPR